jgi:hypothetical protein
MANNKKGSGQKRTVDQLSEAYLREIDENIIENASEEWSKVSRLVLATMIERDEGVTGLPESLYLERVAALVTEGRLESKGDLSDMKLSEVRLAKKG